MRIFKSKVDLKKITTNEEFTYEELREIICTILNHPIYQHFLKLNVQDKWFQIKALVESMNPIDTSIEEINLLTSFLTTKEVFNIDLHRDRSMSKRNRLLLKILSKNSYNR